MEKVFGKDWNPSDVKEAFDISDDGDYVDGDTEESQLLVGIDDNEKLLSMGRIKVRQVQDVQEIRYNMENNLGKI